MSDQTTARPEWPLLMRETCFYAMGRGPAMLHGCAFAKPPALAIRRKAAADVLRLFRAQNRQAKRNREVPDLDGFFLMAHGAMAALQGAWWPWADDLRAERTPLDCSRTTRLHRLTEMIARFKDGSLIDCIFGEIPGPIADWALKEANEFVMSDVNARSRATREAKRATQTTQDD